MERLTYKNAVGNYFYPKCFEKCDGLGTSSKCDNCELTTSICEKLGKYEDLEEQGRLIKLPCKVGDTVFYINGTLILEYEVVGFSIDRTGAWLMYGEHYVDENDRTYSYNFETDKIGKTVFLTREEAEEKLKEMRGEKHAE